MSQSFPLLCVAVIFCAALPPPPQARTGAAAMTCTDLTQQNDLDGPSHNKHIKRTKCPGVCTKVVPAACFGCMFSLKHL